MSNIFIIIIITNTITAVKTTRAERPVHLDTSARLGNRRDPSRGGQEVVRDYDIAVVGKKNGEQKKKKK